MVVECKPCFRRVVMDFRKYAPLFNNVFLRLSFKIQKRDVLILVKWHVNRKRYPGFRIMTESYIHSTYNHN